MKKVLILIFIIINSTCFSQPSITWQRTYAASHGDDYSYGVVKSFNGEYLVLGQKGGGLYLIKINEYGDTLWTRSTALAASAITSSGDGGCVLASARWVTKYDEDGNLIWSRYHNALGQYPREIIKTVDGGYICCTDFQTFDAQVFKIDSSGYLEWHKEFSSTSYLTFGSALETYNGGYLIGGVDSRQFGDTSRAVIYRLSITGDTIWTKAYKIFNRPTSGLTLRYLNGEYSAAGVTYDSSQISFDKIRPFFMKLDTNGNNPYTKLFSDTGDFCEGLQDFQVTVSNHLIFSTIKLGGSNCNFPITAKIFSTNLSGNILNSNTFTTTSDIELKKILPLVNGDIIFSGVLETISTQLEDIYLIRTDSNLNTSPLSIQNINANFANSFTLYQNYPNPFNPTTKIQYSIPTTQYTILKVYDLLGKEISTLLKQKQNPGTYSVKFDGSNFASGVYFYILEAGSFIETKRMLLIK